MIINRYNQTLAEVLICSYVYYCLDNNLISDHDYEDKIAYLRTIGYKPMNNKLSDLIDWEALKGTGSLSYLDASKYPNGLKRIADKWLEILE